MNADAIDVSKENIQPLRSGRRTAQLGLALLAQNNEDISRKLLQERESYELAIQMYDGEDPLHPRYAFVHWIEQTYPKHGRDANLIPLLEDTITLFKNDERYTQDPRFVELIIKYIESQANSLELYNLFYTKGIGTMCAQLYKAWAEALDSLNDYKQADQVYQLGIRVRAEPLDSLKQAHEAFQLSVGRRMLQGTVDPEDEESKRPNRLVLGKISRSSAAGSLRPPKALPGVLPLHNSNTRPRNTPTNTPLSVYQEEENEGPTLGRASVPMDHFPKSAYVNKENTKEAGQWNQGYKKSSKNLPIVPQSAVTPFKIHHDQTPANKEPTPKSMSEQPNALKTLKVDHMTPVAIFEPPDPSVKPMYCKNKVYAAGREFQLEEIRAATYMKKYQMLHIENEIKKLGIWTPASARKPIRTLADMSVSESCCKPLAEEREVDLVQWSTPHHGHKTYSKPSNNVVPKVLQFDSEPIEEECEGQLQNTNLTNIACDESNIICTQRPFNPVDHETLVLPKVPKIDRVSCSNKAITKHSKEPNSCDSRTKLSKSNSSDSSSDRSISKNPSAAKVVSKSGFSIFVDE